MKNKKTFITRELKRIMVIIMAMVLFPIIPIQSAKAESLSISINYPIEGQSLSFSWNKISKAAYYEYSVRDLTTNSVVASHNRTTGTSGSISGSYVIKGHKYKVWVGAFYEVAESNMPEATANSYIADCAQKRRSTLYGTNYEQYNGTYHKRYDVYEVTCKVCGDFIEYTTETTKEKHTIKNGKCTICGFEEEQSPLNVVVSRNQAKAKVGDTIGATAKISGGSGSYLCDWTVTCDGATITTSDNNESAYNAKATKAGTWRFKISVRDKNTGEKVSGTSSTITVEKAECTHGTTTETLIDTKYIQSNETKHVVRKYYRVTCSLCGDTLNESYYKDSDETHTFNANQKCKKCGFVLPTIECKHENTTAQLKRTELRQCNSDNNHYSVAICRDICANCGETVREEREVITVVPHQFENGKCACGYVKPTVKCDHATQRDTLSTQIEKYSDTAHRMTVTYHVYCECGQIDYQETKETYPEHQFDSNGLCKCGYQKNNKTTVSFSVNKTTVSTGENVTFTITTNAATVNFVADGVAYNTVSVTGGKATFVRAFSEKGDRQIKFVTPDGTSSDTKTIHVTANAQLDKTTVTVPASVKEGNSFTVSWTAVKHATKYIVRLYDDASAELWKRETADTSVTIPANSLKAGKHYTVSVIATGANYTQRESNAGFVVTGDQKKVVITGAFGQKSFRMAVGEALNVPVSARTENARLTRVTINVEGSDNNRFSSKEISGTNWNGTLTLNSSAAPLNVPGNYTIKLFVAADAGNPNWAEVDQATLVIAETQDASLDEETADDSQTNIPDFSASVTTTGFGGNVTVNWTAPVWPEDLAKKPSSYVIWWYGPGMKNGISMSVNNNTLSAVLSGEYTMQQGNYTVDVYAMVQSKAGEIQKRANAEFSISPFIGTPTLEAMGTEENGKPQFRIKAVTDRKITRLSGVNNSNYPLKETWTKTSNANGTITWERVYGAEVSAKKRSWTLTAWVGTKAVGSATTNTTQDLHVHIFGDMLYKSMHPHQCYQKCTECGVEQELPNQYYTANGVIQGVAACCVCHGHQYGDAYEENGAWYQKCIKCGKKNTANAPENQNNLANENIETIQGLLAEASKNSQKVQKGLMDFIKIDSYVSQSQGSITRTTSDSARKNWDNPLFRTSVYSYEEAPSIADPLEDALDIGLDAAEDGELTELMDNPVMYLADKYGNWADDEKVQLAIELVQEAVLSNNMKDETLLQSVNKWINEQLNAGTSKIKEVKDRITLFNAIVGDEYLDYMSNINGASDANIQKAYYTKGISGLGTLKDGLELITDLSNVLTEMNEDNIIVAELISDYGKNLSFIEALERSSGDPAIREACRLIKQKMGIDVTNEVNKYTFEAGSIVVRFGAEKGLEEATKILFPGYNETVSLIKAAVNDTERRLNKNDALRTKNKIEASKILLLLDDLSLVTKPNLSFWALEDGKLSFEELQLYYTVIEHKFDAIEDYLMADQSTEFQVTYLNQERKQFEDSYKELINAYYNSLNN